MRSCAPSCPKLEAAPQNRDASAGSSARESPPAVSWPLSPEPDPNHDPLHRHDLVVPRAQRCDWSRMPAWPSTIGAPARVLSSATVVMLARAVRVLGSLGLAKHPSGEAGPSFMCPLRCLADRHGLAGSRRLPARFPAKSTAFVSRRVAVSGAGSVEQGLPSGQLVIPNQTPRKGY